MVPTMAPHSSSYLDGPSTTVYQGGHNNPIRGDHIYYRYDDPRQHLLYITTTKRKAPAVRGLLFYDSLWLDDCDVCSLQAFSALLNGEFHALAFF